MVQHLDGGPVFDAIAFNAVRQHPSPPDRLHLVYQLDLNEWRGQVSLQLRIDHMEPA